MLKVPTSHWQDPERLKWMVDISTRLRWNQFTWDPPNVGANSTVDTTLTAANLVTLTGLRAGMNVTVTAPSTLPAGIAVGGQWVATDNTLTIRLVNVTAAPIDPASGTWAYLGVLL